LLICPLGQILQPADATTEAIALDVIESFVDTVHSEHDDKPDGNDEVEGIVHAVCQDCIQALREPEKNQARSAVKILCVFASSKRWSF
jgi:DNA repair/transcription protein MET18/MMS19